MAHATHARIPPWTALLPAAAGLMLALKFAHVVPAEAVSVQAISALLLGTCVFAAVHHAEVLAMRLGEPYGSILLAVAVTTIEVALIVSLMLSDPTRSGGVARDAVFAAVMIVLNGVIGVSLVIGGLRHHEQYFQLQGAASALAVLGTLAVITLMLPVFTLSTRGLTYAPVQLLVVGIASLALWCMFLLAQTRLHRDYFLEARDGPGAEAFPHDRPPGRIALLSFGLLLLSLVAVVLLAKLLTPALDRGIEAAGLPPGFVGVVIATLVLLPESIAALRSAAVNRLQNSMNLALGSAIASIGLTIPIVAAVALALGKPLDLGLSAANMTLLMLTLFASTLTLGTGRTTVLHGTIHLVIFAVFLLISAVP
jgi:Ca2+:H+ antiporter